ARRAAPLVLRLGELVEARPGIRGVELEVESCALDGLLLVAGEPGEAVREGVGDAEVHRSAGNALHSQIGYGQPRSGYVAKVESVRRKTLIRRAASRSARELPARDRQALPSQYG